MSQVQNQKMMEWSKAWLLDGDLCRCRKCKRGIIASRSDESFVHAAGCQQAHMNFPWRDLHLLISSQATATRTLETQRDEARAEVERLRKALDEKSFRAGWDAKDANYGNLCPPTVEEVWLQHLEGGDQISINDPQHVDAEQKEVVTFSPTQPEIFEAHGREWYRHTPGDKMPCDGEMIVSVLLNTDDSKGSSTLFAKYWNWHKGPYPHIIGWRPADAPEKLPRKGGLA